MLPLRMKSNGNQDVANGGNGADSRPAGSVHILVPSRHSRSLAAAAVPFHQISLNATPTSPHPASTQSIDAPNLKMASIAAAVSPIAAQLALARTEKSTVRPRTRESACSDDAPIDGRIGVQF